jgi:hypothetical protein
LMMSAASALDAAASTNAKYNLRLAPEHDFVSSTETATETQRHREYKFRKRSLRLCVSVACDVTAALRWCKPLKCSGSRGDRAPRRTFSTGFSTETVSNPRNSRGTLT